MAWLWTFNETIAVFHNTCETILGLMEKYPDFCFCQSSAQLYKWLEEKHPETFEKVKRRVEDGRWEIVGGTWVESDGNLPSGESLVRQLLHGKRYFKERFGVDVKTAWMPDSFGYAWTLPQIMKKAGIKYFLTQKMNWNDTTVFPYNFFRWVAPDGSSILAHQTVGSYSEPVTETDILEQMKLLNSHQQLDDLLLLFGVGDHGGGVTFDMITAALEFVQGKKQIKGVFSTAEMYFNVLTKKTEGKKIPQINDELYLQFHRGTYTTQAKVKKNNRRAECLLETAEKFSILARKYGYEYPSKELKEAWEKLLLNQFHDVLPGSSIPEVYKDSEECFEFIFNTANSIISKSLKAIATKIDTTGEGKSLLVFNPLSWARSDAVEVPLDELENEFEIYDEQGRIISSQVIEGKKKIVFIAEDVPSVGYKEYRAKRTGHKMGSITSLSSVETENEIKLENEFFIVKVDKKTGLAKSIFDKTNRKEIFQDDGNRIQIFEDYPVSGRASIRFGPGLDAVVLDAWEVYIYQQDEGAKYVELKDPVEVKLVENGPVRTRVSVKYKYAQERRPDSVFVQEIMLYDKIPLVSFKLHVDWHTEHRLAKVAFPLNVHSDFTTYEVPYGFITRRNPRSPNAAPHEKAKYEAPGQKWIDHSSEDESYGVSLLNDCKYGFDTADDVIRMTLLRSARVPIEMRAEFGLPVDKEAELTDQGEHQIAYALYPHRSDSKEALTTRKAYEFNYPLLLFVEPSHDGKLPKVYSFVSVQPNNIILTVIKKAEDSNDIILRFYETSGKNAKAVVHIAETLKEARKTDLLENETSEISMQEEKLELSISKHAIETIKLLTRP